MIGRLIVGVVLLFGILLLMLPKSDEESLARIASASMLMCTVEFRERVARQVLMEAPVAEVFNNQCPSLIASLEVDEAGAMVITGQEHPLTMMLTPVIAVDRVRWSCRGEPAAAVTSLCRP